MANIEEEGKKAVENAIKRKAEEVNNSTPSLEIPEQKKVSSSVPEVDTSALSDAINAPGYNTGAKVGKNINDNSSLDLPKNYNDNSSIDIPKNDNLVKPSATDNKTSQNSNLKEPLNNNREQAPDIGKDYGSTPSYNNSSDKATKTSSASEIPERNNNVTGNNHQNYTSNQNPNNSLEKKDGLDDSDKNSNLDKKNDGLTKKDNDKVESNGEKNNSVNDLSSGNGYGAIKNKPTASSQNDGTSLARKNLEHNKRMQQGQENGSKVGKNNSLNNAGNNLKKSSGNVGVKENLGSKNPLSNFGSKLKNGLGNLGKGAKGKAANKLLGGKGTQVLKKKVVELIVKNPYVLIVIGVVIIIFVLMFMSTLSDATSSSPKGSGGGAHCTYNLAGISSVGEIQLEGLQVELVNCDATPSDYTVLETIDFEKYVLGVALAEIGPSSPDEAIKSLIVAARGFALTRNVGMCPSNQDDCFYGYNASTGKIRMRACEADQVYWNYEKDIYREDRGAISLYSPEINSGTIWKNALSEERINEVKQLASEVRGKVLIDSNNNVIRTGYTATEGNQFIEMANEGKSYEEILSTVYTESNGLSSAECNSYGNIDYGDYVLSSDGDEILHEPLESFLASKGTSIDEFNSLISENVQKAGYGTRAGVVAAAVTLIGELGNKYDVRVPYYWSGGHYDGVVDGALGYWGSDSCHYYANGQNYNYCGLDCSGFVPWAIKNGGFNISQMLAGDFVNLDGAEKVRLSNEPVLEPGDLLEGEGHIVLVIGIEETTGKYICAEASGNEYGVWFSRRNFEQSGYYGIKMDGFYNTHAR